MRRVLAIAIVVVLAGAIVLVVRRGAEAPDALTAPVERLLAAGDVAAARAERESVRGRLDAGWNDYLDGVLLLSEGKDHDAADVLGRARRAHPDAWRIVSATASATANDGRFADALHVIEEYSLSTPDDERGLAALARCRLDARFGPPDSARALAALDRIAALPKRVAPPGDPTAVPDALLHRLRAKALVIGGRGMDGIEEAREATRADPSEAESWYVLGDACRLARPPHPDEALDAYAHAFSLAPQMRRYGEQLVMATLEMVLPGTEAQRFAVASSALDSMLQRSPDDAALLILKARMLARDEKTLDLANDLYADLEKRDLPKELMLQVLRNRGVLLYDFKVGGRPGVYLKDAYDRLKRYVDEGGVVDDKLRDAWTKLRLQFEKR